MAMRMTHAGTVAISSKAVTPQRFRPATKTRHLIEYDDPSHDVSVASSFYFSPTMTMSSKSHSLKRSSSPPTNNHHNQQKVTYLTSTEKDPPTSFPPNEEATNMLQFLNEQGYQLQNDQFRSTKLPAYHHHHQAQQQQQQAGSNNNHNNNKTPNSFVSSSFSPKRRPKQMFKGKFAGVSSAALEEMKDDDDDDDDDYTSNSRRTKGYPSGSFFTIHEKGENKKRWKTLWFLFP